MKPANNANLFRFKTACSTSISYTAMNSIFRFFIICSTLLLALPAFSQQTRYFNFCTQAVAGHFHHGEDIDFSSNPYDPNVCLNLVAEATEIKSDGYTANVISAVINFHGILAEIVETGTVQVSPDHFSYTIGTGGVNFDLKGYWSGIDGKYHGFNELNGYFTGHGLRTNSSDSFRFWYTPTSIRLLVAESYDNNFYPDHVPPSYLNVDFISGPIPELATVNMMVLGLIGVLSIQLLRRRHA